MKVWILFGNEQRSDGKNIEGVYMTEKAAKDNLKYLEECHYQFGYHIEQHDVLKY